MIQFDLQLFAEKTERATAKRRTDARREGRMAKSPDLTMAFSFLGVIVALGMYGQQLYVALAKLMIDLLSEGLVFANNHVGLPGIFYSDLQNLMSALIPLLLLGMGIGVVISFLQVGPTFVLKGLYPNFSKINPFSGLKQLFGVQSVAQLVKSTLKLIFIAVAVYFALAGSSGQFAQLMVTDPIYIIQAFASRAFSIVLDVAGMYVALSIFDFFFQRFQFERSMRMSKEEVKDEMKQQEGNPQVKGKLRERGRAIAFRRMMQKVPIADVIITNPTHFAVALKYDASTMHAPQVVAKGVDQIALRIRETAREHDVPIVENRPLARSLYQTVEIDGFIPGDLFQAVAEVLAYVYRLKKRTV